MNRQEAINKLQKEIIEGNREVNYGNPENNFKNIAKLWSAYLGYEIHPYQVAMMMVLFKTGRLMNNPKHEDSLLDIAGYSLCCLEMMTEKKYNNWGGNAG